MKRLPTIAIVATLALVTVAAFASFAAVASAAPAPRRTANIRPLRGESVTPHAFQFSALEKRRPHEGLIVEVPKPRAFDEAEERAIEKMKKNPIGRTPEEMGNVTIDRNPGPFVSSLLRGDTQPFAPIANNGFDGISQGGYIPGEPTVAAGPLNIFTAGNSSVTVTNKDGTSRVETAGTTFFAVTPGEGGISDAQCYYDALRGRFVALCFTTGPSYSNFYLAVSQTNDARGSWWRYKFDMTKDGTTPSGNWADYQSLGISDDKIAMTGQMYSLSGGNYLYQKVRVLDRAAAYAGQTLTYFDFVNWAPPSGGDYRDLFVTKAARNLSAGDNDLHLLCVPVAGGTTVTSTTIFGPPSSPSMSVPVLVPVRPYAMPANALQKGSATSVPTNDCRPTDFYVRNGVLTCAWHESVSLGGLVSAIRLFQLRTNDLAVMTDETYVASGVYMYYPAVTVDSVGTIFLGFDRSSATEYPSAYITGKRRGDATLQPSVLLKAGVSPTAQSRWGDYTGIDNDAALSGPGGSVAWYAGQYTKGTNTFGAWIHKVTFTYGQVTGTVGDDCDGLAGTTSDRSPLAGVTVALKQGATTLQTTTTNGSGAYAFGWLESGTYDVVVTPPASGANVDAVAGSGGTSQTRVSASTVQVTLTNSQTSAANAFFVTSSHPAPIATGLSPYGRVAGAGGFTLTVNGANFARCATVRWDGVDRATTWVSATQLTAAILAADVASAGSHAVTVFNPAPGGGTSNAMTFTVTSGADTQAPVVSVTAPAGGQSWAIGSLQTITWTATDDTGVNAVDIAWSADGGATFPNAIATGVANTGTFNWTVSGQPTATARVRVRAYDSGSNVGSDSSHTNVAFTGWTVTASAGANGTISPAGAVGVGDGATPNYTITPAAGYKVADVLVNGVSVGAVTNHTFAAIHANQTIAASFTLATYALNVTVSGSGTVTKTPDLAQYPAHSSVTLTAVAPSGWAFDSWSGDLSSTANPVGVTMSATRNITATFTQHVYTWNAAGGGDWTVASNWTPARNAPSNDDLLQFTGGTVVVTNIPNQTIGKLSLSGGANVTLQPSLPSSILTFTGRTGADFDVPAGCTLTLNGSAALTIALASGATGLVGGTIQVSNAAHRLTALDGGALVFVGGSQCLIGTAFTGNIFGNGGATSAANSVVMQSGSLLAQASGNNPFGIAVPNSCVIFQAGSRYRVDGNLVLSVSGRTYADLEYNYTGALSVSGPSAFSLDSLIVTRGTLNWNMTGGGTIRGDVVVKSGATLNMNPASGTPVTQLGGTLLQYVDVAGSFSSLANLGLAVNNPSGVVLRRNFTFNGPFAFTSGRVITNANSLNIGAAGSVTGAGASTGWVVGNLRRNFASGSSSRIYDIGDFTIYSPVALTMNGAAGAFDVTASATTGDHPQIASSDLDADQSVNRWWSLSRTAATAFTSYDAVFNFDAADLDAGALPAQLVARRYAAGWNTAAIGVAGATSLSVTGQTAFGEFALGEISAVDNQPPTVAVTSPNGGEVLVTGGNASLTWSAGDNVGVTAVDLYLSRDGRGGPYDAIATDLANSGTYSWAVSAPYTSTAWLRVVARDGTGNAASDTSNAAFSILGATGVDGGGPVTAYALSPVFPNPLRTGAATFAFALPAAGHVKLSVLDVQGRQVLSLADGEYAAGRHALAVNAGARGSLGAGLYFVRLQVAGRTFTRRFVVAQ
ncbi:MAG: T9SS type A sorting domain-containing protein [Candidatus Eisenbacteria bacterium]|uniref:T9SS type A sorting domain-containing protein n=1 Tax=Eiseniibacteriota bacterium TaxID=2212470 RepID=A0A933SDL8_UNCEI|nr:T9SS type A sorting domain-containing protein [Candidatus Eisenbacteria bacterium]